MTTKTLGILEQVRLERVRQAELIAAGKIPWACENPKIKPAPKLAVLGEEYGECCRAYLEGDTAQLKKELIQTAAVAVAFAESIPD